MAAPVQVGGPGQRARLALLLCNANQIISRGRLIDEVFADQPAGSARRMLGVQLSRVRQALLVAGKDRRLIPAARDICCASTRESSS